MPTVFDRGRHQDVQVRGTFILAKTYLEHLNPEYLRYYYAAKLNGSVDDLDLNLEDFAARVNSDLVGKVVNIASRTAGFLVKQFDGVLAEQVHDPELMNQFHAQVEPIAALFEQGDTAKAMREITSLADCSESVHRQTRTVEYGQGPRAT